MYTCTQKTTRCCKKTRLTERVYAEGKGIDDGLCVPDPKKMQRFLTREQGREVPKHLKHVVFVLAETATYGHPIERERTEVPNAEPPLCCIGTTMNDAVPCVVIFWRFGLSLIVLINITPKTSDE